VNSEYGWSQDAGEETTGIVAKATMLYAAPIWNSVTERTFYLKEARAVYQTMALRLIRGFRTISEDAALVLACIPPIDLEVKALAAKREGVSKTSANERLLVEWQTRWHDSQKGRWTQHLIPDVAAWIRCKYKELDYHLTQFLT
ncbi:hypothetical protein KR018_009734, partial [Drosophila ironensis]